MRKFGLNFAKIWIWIAGTTPLLMAYDSIMYMKNDPYVTYQTSTYILVGLLTMVSQILCWFICFILTTSLESIVKDFLD